MGLFFHPMSLTEDVVLNFTSNDTLVAHFVADVEYTLTLNAVPASGGTITLNGTVYDTFPATVTIAGSSLNEVSAQPIAGWGFENWSPSFTINGTVTTNPVEFSLESDGALTATFFEVIYDVTFDVFPPGVATISVDDETLDEFAQTLILQGNTPIDISTKPIQEFYQFSHWLL